LGITLKPLPTHPKPKPVCCQPGKINSFRENAAAVAPDEFLAKSDNNLKMVEKAGRNVYD